VERYADRIEKLFAFWVWTLTLEYYLDTQVNSCKVSWIAYGEALGTDWNANNAGVIGPDNPGHPAPMFHFPLVAPAAFGFAGHHHHHDDDDDDSSSSSSSSSDSSSDDDDDLGHVAKKQKTGAASSVATAVDKPAGAAASSSAAAPAPVARSTSSLSQEDERECKVCFVRRRRHSKNFLVEIAHVLFSFLFSSM
jgi:hypothetical protein